jgi:hypothetical protein
MFKKRKTKIVTSWGFEPLGDEGSPIEMGLVIPLKKNT